MIAFSFVGTEADEFACGKCRLRWLRQQLWGLSIGSAARRIGSRERWTAKIRLSEEAFPPCGDGSGRWLCPQPFNRLYFSGMGGMDCRLFAGEKFILRENAGKVRCGSPECAGSGENPFLAGQPVLADLFGAAATFCREVAVFDPTFAVGRRIAGRKLPLRAVSVFRISDFVRIFAVRRSVVGLTGGGVFRNSWKRRYGFTLRYHRGRRRSCRLRGGFGGSAARLPHAARDDGHDQVGRYVL